MSILQEQNQIYHMINSIYTHFLFIYHHQNISQCSFKRFYSTFVDWNDSLIQSEEIIPKTIECRRISSLITQIYLNLRTNEWRSFDMVVVSIMLKWFLLRIYIVHFNVIFWYLKIWFKYQRMYFDEMKWSVAFRRINRNISWSQDEKHNLIISTCRKIIFLQIQRVFSTNQKYKILMNHFHMSFSPSLFHWFQDAFL